MGWLQAAAAPVLLATSLAMLTNRCIRSCVGRAACSDGQGRGAEGCAVEGELREDREVVGAEARVGDAVVVDPLVQQLLAPAQRQQHTTQGDLRIHRGQGKHARYESSRF